MKKNWILISTTIALSFFGAFVGIAQADPAANKAMVEKAMTEIFVNRDASAAERYWSDKYIQHNPNMGNGREEIAGAVKTLPPAFTYELGTSIAEGDFVMLQGRYTGFGPVPKIAVDLYRIENGKIAEHWDVFQDEVPASQTKNGNPMFEARK